MRPMGMQQTRSSTSMRRLGTFIAAPEPRLVLESRLVQIAQHMHISVRLEAQLVARNVLQRTRLRAIRGTLAARPLRRLAVVATIEHGRDAWDGLSRGTICSGTRLRLLLRRWMCVGL